MSCELQLIQRAWSAAALSYPVTTERMELSNVWLYVLLAHEASRGQYERFRIDIDVAHGGYSQGIDSLYPRNASKPEHCPFIRLASEARQ